MYQQLIIVGNLGRDPEMRYTPSGTPVTEFSMAVNRRYQNSQGEYVDNTTWYTVTCWRRLAETTYKYLKKGRQVMVVSDRIEADSWIDKNTGEARAKLKVTASDVRFLSGGDYNRDEYGGGDNYQSNDYSQQQTEEDLPF
jgi:single-strand DNA-binding protein